MSWHLVRIHGSDETQPRRAALKYLGPVDLTSANSTSAHSRNILLLSPCSSQHYLLSFSALLSSGPHLHPWSGGWDVLTVLYQMLTMGFKCTRNCGSTLTGAELREAEASFASRKAALSGTQLKAAAGPIKVINHISTQWYSFLKAPDLPHRCSGTSLAKTPQFLVGTSRTVFKPNMMILL